jgi:hypothetical protein
LTGCRARAYNAAVRVVLLALFTLIPAFAAEPGPTLVVAERVHDAGEIERGVTLKHAFVLKNTGTANLSVDAKPG